ncbi:MAG: Gldg family protein [Akkermansiaceae bacterium]|nr:Gldg family protein [Akkermansiaceae bacterium]
MAHKPTYPVTRAAFGVAALVAIVILANWLISLTPLGNRGHDFTENKNHTLSDGTRAILKDLDTQVVIRYYASRSTNYMPEQLKLHMRRVDDLLKEYASLSGGRLRIENLDPEPDTDAEDSANLDGISGQRIDDENLYFGLAVNCLDRTAVIPFLEPRDETMLEYNLSKAIAEVTTPVKPVIGVMSALDLKGGPAMMQGQRPSPPWVFYQQLKQSFEVKDLGMTPPAIDPKEIKVLLLFHPAGITPEVEFLVDQYLLGGGTVVVAVDAFSITAQMAGGGNPMMGMGGGVPTTSTLPTLFGAWGVSFESGQTLADPAYKTKMNTRNGAADAITVLTLPQAAMPQKDNVVTKDLSSIMLLLPGGFTKTSGGGVDINTLVRSTTGAGFVDSMQASRLDPSLAMTLKSTGTAYDLVSHLHGTFKTAFPNGKPGEESKPEPEEKKPEIGQLPAEIKKPEPKPVWLKAGTAPGNVFLIADVDAFHDQFAYNPQMLQLGMASPANGNASLLFNLLDQATGSKYLIGSRSRAAVRRPFTVIQEMETDFDKEVGDKITKFQKEVDATNQKLSELQAQRSSGADLHLTPEQEAEIKKLREVSVDNRRKIREMEKDLRRQKDGLTGRITLANVVIMPVIVILVGLGLFIARRSATRAR